MLSAGIIWIRKKKKRQECYLSVMWQRLITLTHHRTRDSLSSVYYTGLRGEIDLKWQLLGPFLWRVKLTCTRWRLRDWSTCVILSQAVLSGYIEASVGCIFFMLQGRKSEEKARCEIEMQQPFHWSSTIWLTGNCFDNRLIVSAFSHTL